MKKTLLSAAAVAVLAGAGYYLYDTQQVQADKSAEKPEAAVVSYHATNCPSGTSDSGYSIKGKQVCEIANIITNDLTLTEDRYWRIRGEVQIGGDNSLKTTLTIDPGTVLFGKSGKDFLVINRGSKIVAEGTGSKPITFTSENDVKGLKAVSGEWGGVVIAGNAPINTGNHDEPFEFSKRQIHFGGDQPDDDSGVLKYVVIKYAGDEVMPQKELNGLSLGGVGNGTLIDYIEVYMGKDDGIELWGGTVNMKHVLLMGNRDDSLDTDLGYRGNIQYLYAEQFRLEAGQYGNGIEADNLKANMAAQPISHPVLANFEFVGSAGSVYGILLRHGTGYTLINGVVTGFDDAQLAIHDDQTLANNEILFRSVALDGSEEAEDLYHAKNGVTPEEIGALFDKGVNCATDSRQTVPTRVKSFTKDAFFEEAPFVGAYEKGKDWRTGWSVGL